MKKNNGYLRSNRMQAGMIFAVSVVLVACVEHKDNPTLPDVLVNIVFDEAGCPTTIDPNEIPKVNKASNQRIVWQAIREGGDTVDNRYRIYFDPFKGQPLHANRQGYQRSPRFDSDIPTGVQYKYTIVGDDCREKPLDPRFYVD